MSSATMSYTDAELDREWVPNGRRPQSTIAQSFSQELMDIFRLDNSVNDLDEEVNKRKQQVTTQATELEALESRIRQMEDLLRRNGQKPAPTQQLPHHPSSAAEQGRNASRDKQNAPGSANMPPTPSASEDGDR